jgi:hypothetical protein
LTEYIFFLGFTWIISCLFYLQLLILMNPGGRLSMKGLKILLCLAAGCLFAGSLNADIYEWTDEKGVKHFTNYAPPEHATILMKSEELPYDEAADRSRIEAERQQQVELAILEIAAREAELEQREAEAQRRAAEAERYAEETVRAADQYLEDARNDLYDSRGGGYYGYLWPPYYRRWSYRNSRTRTYFPGSPHIDHYNPKYQGKRHSGGNYGIAYGLEKHAYPRNYQSPHAIGSPGRAPRGTYRVNAWSSGQIGRVPSGSGSYGLRR